MALSLVKMAQKDTTASSSLVMTNIANWKITISNGKQTISMAIFNSYVTNYRKVVLQVLKH